MISFRDLLTFSALVFPCKVCYTTPSNHLNELALFALVRKLNWNFFNEPHQVSSALYNKRCTVCKVCSTYFIQRVNTPSEGIFQ